MLTVRWYAAAALVVVALVGAAALGTPTPFGPPPADDDPPATDHGASAIAFQELHARNVTGEGIRVGIVDPTGFDPSAPALAARVVETRSFDRGNAIQNRGFNRHGTAAAETIATVAPDADLYLANFDAESGFVDAVDWMRDREVDVVVAPLSFYGKPDDGTSAVARAADRAVDDGVVFVAPTGNLARGHWEGRFEPDENGTHSFADDQSRNRLTPAASSDRVVLWLSWDRAHRHQDYDLVLYRREDGSEERVATSSPFEEDRAPNERVAVERRPGQYWYAVVGPENGSRARIEVVSPTHAFEHARPAGSIAAPATADGVLAVGAYDVEGGRVAGFSSRGPTADGRVGVDLVAPGTFRAVEGTRFVGSSSAATYVGGVVALLLSEAPEMTPVQVEETLEYTVVDVEAPGHSARSGYGLIDPDAALARVERR